MVDLNSQTIRYIKGIGQTRADKFQKLGIESVGDLLSFFPKRYEDLSQSVSFLTAPKDEKVAIVATVRGNVESYRTKNNLRIFSCLVSDENDTFAKITIFNNVFDAKKLTVGKKFIFYGKVQRDSYGLNMPSPEILEISNLKIRPVYRQTAGLNSKFISACISNAILKYGEDIADSLPSKIKSDYKLIEKKDAIEQVHFPTSFDLLEKAKNRLIYEELFIFSLGILKLKSAKKQKSDTVIKDDYSKDFDKLIPFEPTSYQKTALQEIIKDFVSPYPMRRLLQGDVGSGKTYVAAAAAYTAIRNQYQVAFMAPTEILANQHFETLSNYFKNKKIKISLLTSSTTKKARNEILENLKSGEINLVVGTHSLLSTDVEFSNLGFVVTDEQHRFGVLQRKALENKGRQVNVLVMSATPIPRTLALSVYADLDISIMKGRPSNRKKIKTYRIDSSIRKRCFDFIKKQIDSGRQAYIVCSLIEENEEMSQLVSAEDYYKKIKNSAFKNYRVALIHGQMKSKEKEQIMQEFKQGNIDVLVSTTVIEVGIDVPNATVMLIENAERFGLSALHQLRGRIGRGKEQSYCILLSDSKSQKTNERLQVLVKTDDGFKISEADLKLRGPGDFFGSKQHGLPEFKLADMLNDISVFNRAMSDAKKILDKDFDLSEKEQIDLEYELEKMFKKI
ncbi:MAG: ATP-dependent DNA helicase RecG [Clostridia bacterium]|nr:ATP-dependent DNA helicase RecG [Clostridia bacterium]